MLLGKRRQREIAGNLKGIQGYSKFSPHRQVYWAKFHINISNPIATDERDYN